MDYRHLKYFMEVAEQKSFSKAARNLHISQSVSYTHLTLPTKLEWCRSRWSPYH